MTKRDKQASEYAAESYEKTLAKRGVSHMSWALTDEEREAIEWAVETSDYYASAGHRQAKDAAATLRKLLERLA